MYILLCNDSSYYVGSTKDVGLRFWQHSNGQGEGAEYTLERLPVYLVYVEVFSRIDFAFNREQQIKKWTRKKKQALINGKIQELKTFSKKKFKAKIPE